MEVNGRVLRSNTRGFVFGTRVPKGDVPVFGAFVKTRIQRRNATVFGLIYNIEVQDDGMTKMMSVAEDGVVTPDDIEWQRNRRVPVEASVLCVGYQEEGEPIRQSLSAQPPITLDVVEACEAEEVCAFTERLDFFRLVLEARDAPCDELLAASIRLAGGAQPDSTSFTRRCGVELARLLANDGARLDGLLRRLV
jgi:hypothetical protein